MRKKDKNRVLSTLENRVVSGITLAAANGTGPSVEEVIGDTLFQEHRRLKTAKDSPQIRLDRALWSDVRRDLLHATEAEQTVLLERIVTHFTTEIAGNFRDTVYRFATRMLPPTISVLLNAMSPRRFASSNGRIPDVTQTLRVQGEVEHLRSLHRQGTVILTPTHISNLDSIIVGLALWLMGLPPVLYGAGLNLFSNPVLGFFMNNLGAYTVDRRKKNALYKSLLKNYTTCTLEAGYNNLFFPGGTRSRSGAVERHLKLGLLGTGVTAYINNLRHQRPNPKIFVVPVTLCSQLVLEAETLIEDWLKESGKSRYIITDDEFSMPRRVVAFITQLISLESRITITVCRGYDTFGNPIDSDGVSYDPVGRAIDTSRYVCDDSGPCHDAQRDAEYTHEVGARLSESFMANNVVFSTHVLARSIFRLLHHRNPHLDLFRLLRTGGHERNLGLREVYQEAEHLMDQLQELAAADKIRLDHDLAKSDTEQMVRDGLKHFATYHTTAAARRRGDRLIAEDRNILLYYANRLDGYELDNFDATRQRT